MKRAGGCGEADEGAVAKVGRGTLSRAGTPRRGAQHGYTTTRGGEGLGVGIETQMRLRTSVCGVNVKVISKLDRFTFFFFFFPQFRHLFIYPMESILSNSSSMELDGSK